MKKTIFTIGILLTFTAGTLFIVCLLLFMANDSLNRDLALKGIILSAVVLLPAFVATVFSGVIVWKEFRQGIDRQNKWRRRS